MPNGVFSVEELREEVLRAVKNSRDPDATRNQIDESHLVFVRDARSYDHLILAIDKLTKVEPFNSKLKNELKLIKQFTNTARRQG